MPLPGMKLMMRPAALAMICAAQSAAAFQPPAGCEGVMTVQYSGCIVEHVWRCERDRPGEQWIGLFDEDGPFQLRKVDEEFQWLETFYFNPTATERMLTPAPDPASLDELFASREDLYDFTVERGGVRTRYQGYDRLTGETVVIDGEPLLRTEFSYQAIDEEGEVLRSRMGRQYVSEKYRLFFFGSVWDAETPDQVTDNSPRSFAFPGDDGFLANDPAFGCNPLMSGLPAGEGAA